MSRKKRIEVVRCHYLQPRGDINVPCSQVLIDGVCPIHGLREVDLSVAARPFGEPGGLMIEPTEQAIAEALDAYRGVSVPRTDAKRMRDALVVAQEHDPVYQAALNVVRVEAHLGYSDLVRAVERLRELLWDQVRSYGGGGPAMSVRQMLAEARLAAQDRGAALGMLSTQPDVHGLGEAGEAAARATLRYLRDEDDGAWLTIDGAEFIDSLLHPREEGQHDG